MKAKYAYKQRTNLMKIRRNAFVHPLYVESRQEKLMRVKNYVYWYIIDMMIAKKDVFLKLYPSNFEKSVEEEIDMASISKNDRVLHIGCGSYPITAIVIEKITGAFVVALDRKYAAVELAEKYRKDKNIKNIKIEYGDGIKYSAKDFDVIIITSIVMPRKEVLDNIFKTSNRNCRIICRELDDAKNSSKRYILFNGVIIKRKIKPGGNWISYLITKRNS